MNIKMETNIKIVNEYKKLNDNEYKKKRIMNMEVKNYNFYLILFFKVVLIDADVNLKRKYILAQEFLV